MSDQVMLELLTSLNASQDIKASAVVSIDGLSIESAFAPGIDQDRIGAMSASMLTLSVRCARELLSGTLDHAIIHTDSGYMMFFQATDSVLLVLTTPPDAKLGLVLVDIRNALKAIKAYYA